jgi:uncharacterized membrane protein YuzA (DUF378 family)
MSLRERSPLLAGVLVTVVSAAAAVGLFLITWMLYVLPVAPLAALLGGNAPAAYAVLYILVPLAGVMFLRSPAPWWARWVCLGVMATNVALAFYTQMFNS